MKTPILDEFIEELQELKDDNFFLTKDLEERLIEFKNIKAAINYTHCCKSDSELLVCDRQFINAGTLQGQAMKRCLKCGKYTKAN
jgi:hypothetical protein